MAEPFDLVILSNGPGEISTWVRPVVKAIRMKFGTLPRISVVLSPCSNGTGQEAAIARSYPEVDRVQSAEYFFSFLLFGKTKENWQWFARGLVLFLGGDQFFPLVIGKRLGFKTLIYAEWEARWWRYIDAFAVMNEKVIVKVPPRFHHKFTVVGDLMIDIESETHNRQSQPLIFGLLPGSKAMKLSQGLPLCLAIAEKIAQARPDSQFILPVAPTLTLKKLAQFADPQQNSIIAIIKGQTAKLQQIQNQSYLVTPTGLKVQLVTEFPAYQYLKKCCLCLTTIGANTAELGALGIPMLVLLPTQEITAMTAWDGLPGLIAKIPFVGKLFIYWFNRRFAKLIAQHNYYFAWPNIWAQRKIIPELLGDLTPDYVANIVLDYLEHPAKLNMMRTELRQLRGASGAAAKLTEAIAQTLKP